MVEVVEYGLLATFCLGLLTFILMYLRSNWRENIIGRYLMYFMANIAFLFVYLLFGALIPKFPGRVLLDMAILLSLNYGAWKITWLLFKIQKLGSEDADEHS